jgi:hypothetical protein
MPATTPHLGTSRPSQLPAEKHPACWARLATLLATAMQEIARWVSATSRLPATHDHGHARGWLLSGPPGGQAVRGFRRATGGSSNAYDRPCCGLLPSDFSPVGGVAVLSPAGTMHQVHRRDASLWIVPDWLVRIVPQVPGNRMAGAPRGGSPARDRLGHRPDRKAAAARRTRGRNGPPASLRSSVRLYGHGPACFTSPVRSS